jgi:hypothetical protein
MLDSLLDWGSTGAIILVTWHIVYEIIIVNHIFTSEDVYVYVYCIWRNGY